MLKNTTLVTLRNRDRYCLGIKTDRGILDVAEATAVCGIDVPVTIEEMLQNEGSDQALRDLLVRAHATTAMEHLYIDEARAEFGPCVTRPEKIICIGLNYRQHAAETRFTAPGVPVLFNKYNNALCPHRGTIRVSQIPAQQFDYEAELVIVIGRTARNVTEDDALSYVLGYCVGNDFSARDLQMRTSQWMLGKTADGFAPLGPYLVTADQIPDPNNLKIECRVNGEVRQSGTTADMIFNCATLVSYISRHFTLRPGDLIFTGTPEGVILGYPEEDRVWLKPGDRVTTTIERLGTLEFELA